MAKAKTWKNEEFVDKVIQKLMEGFEEVEFSSKSLSQKDKTKAIEEIRKLFKLKSTDSDFILTPLYGSLYKVHAMKKGTYKPTFMKNF